MSYITVEEYYQHTNGGLDIIVELFLKLKKLPGKRTISLALEMNAPQVLLYISMKVVNIITSMILAIRCIVPLTW
jgi:hypothetical protein